LISLQPDSVTISGTKENISKIDSVYTESLNITGLKKTHTSVLKLENLNGINYNIGEVDVKIPVEQFTEKMISLKITPSNVPANYELNTIPDLVTLKLSVPLSIFNKIVPEQFIVSAEFPDQKTGTTKILLKVDQKPSFVKVVSMTPVSVEYKIKAKE
jgi:hypothetical protein